MKKSKIDPQTFIGRITNQRKYKVFTYQDPITKEWSQPEAETPARRAVRDLLQYSKEFAGRIVPGRGFRKNFWNHHQRKFIEKILKVTV